MDPLTIAAVASMMVGAYMTTQAQNAAAEYQAKIARRNARAASQEAVYARQVSHEKEMDQRAAAAKFLGRQKAAMGSSGLDIGSTNFVDLMSDSEVQLELDALAIRHEGDMAAWRAEISQGNYLANASASLLSREDPFATSAAAGLSTWVSMPRK